jgi:S-formylglutathione hydrolase FrmB
VSADRSAWALMGYSTGGYCALKIALRFPQYYASAASILGNTSPYQDAGTGPVFMTNPGLREANNPVWLVTHGARPDISILFAASRGDPVTLRDALAFSRLAQEPTQVQVISAAAGGHNFNTFRLYESVAFDWLSGQLRAPLAPAASISEVTPRQSHDHR